jgi:SulP family sulfate permease
MLHAAFLLLFILIAAPLASYIPLAALAGVLAVVAWSMAEKQEFIMLTRASWGDAIVLLVTFLLVIFRDLSAGILIGFALSALLFMHRMAQGAAVENVRPLVEEDTADRIEGPGGRPYDAGLATDPDISIVRVSGAFFFGAAAEVGAALDRIGDQPKAYVLDLSAVSVLDSTGAVTVEAFARKAIRRGAGIYIAGATPAVRRTLMIHGLKPPRVRFRRGTDGAVARIRKELAASASPGLAAP